MACDERSLGGLLCVGSGKIFGSSWDGVPPPKSFTELAEVSLLVGYDEPILQKDKSIMECGVAWD